MLDRASTFAQPEIVSLLKTRFIPVAIDQAYQRRQKDAEGEFYRQIASQGPRHDFNDTTQGFYIATASGKLLMYSNNRDPEKVQRLMKQKLADFERTTEATSEVPTLEAGKVDSRFQVQPPAGGIVVRVRAKILDGYEPTTDPWQAIFQSAMSRDNLWVTREEHESLVRGEFPASLQQRIARFHLVDNTRGEPPMWDAKEIQAVDFKLDQGHVTGAVQLQTAKGNRSYDAQVRGHVEAKDGRLTRFDLVALGEFQGHGPFTGKGPKGPFTLAIAFSLADGTDIADKIPPQGSRGWLPGYLGK